MQYMRDNKYKSERSWRGSRLSQVFMEAVCKDTPKFSVDD